MTPAEAGIGRRALGGELQCQRGKPRAQLGSGRENFFPVDWIRRNPGKAEEMPVLRGFLGRFDYLPALNIPDLRRASLWAF